jgi:hypothetical protein
VVGGIQPNYDIKEEDDCGELVLGLHDGQSEENIVFEDYREGHNEAAN